MLTWTNLSPTAGKDALRVIERVAPAVGSPAYPASPHYATLHIYVHPSGAIYACGTDGHRLHAASVGVVRPLLEHLERSATLARLAVDPLPDGWVYAPIPASEIVSVKRALKNWRTGGFSVQGAVYARPAPGKGEPLDLPLHLYGSVWHSVEMAPRPGIYPLTHTNITRQTRFTNELVVPVGTLRAASRAAVVPGPDGTPIYWRPLDYDAPSPGKAGPEPGRDDTIAIWFTAENGGEVRANGVSLGQRSRGGPIDVAVPAEQAEDVLRAVVKGPHKDAVRIHVAGPLDAVLFVEDDPLAIETSTGEAFLALVMPLRMRSHYPRNGR